MADMKTGSQNHWLNAEDVELKRLLRRRYAVAAKHVSGTVLDWACGYGVGTSMMTADVIWGMDINRDAIRTGREHITSANVKLQVGDIEIESAHFASIAPDWLVCTETLEHLQAPMQFLERAQHHVQAGIVVSVPIWKSRNRFHIHDFTANQVRSWFALPRAVGTAWQCVHEEIMDQQDEGKVVMQYLLGVWRRA